MEKFRSTYSIFFKELKDFVEHLLTVYRPEGVPASLQDVPLILTVLPEDDQDFDTMNEGHVSLKTAVVLETTRIVLATVDPYIRQAAKEDFKKESRNLGWRMNQVEMGLGSLTVHNENSQISRPS